MREKGDPAEVHPELRTACFRTRIDPPELELSAVVAPSMRRGDGRARIVALETLDANGKPTSIWRSGEPACVRVAVRFDAAVEDPVVGIMIRTRIGMEVYGTNTELENVKLGPVRGRRHHVSSVFASTATFARRPIR